MRGHACEETGRFVRGGQACGGRQAVEGVGLWGEACREEQLGGGGSWQGRPLLNCLYLTLGYKEFLDY